MVLRLSLILRSLTDDFRPKVTAIVGSTDIDSIPIEELVGSLQTNELEFPRSNKQSLLRWNLLMKLTLLIMNLALLMLLTLLSSLRDLWETLEIGDFKRILKNLSHTKRNIEKIWNLLKMNQINQLTIPWVSNILALKALDITRMNVPPASSCCYT